MSIKEDQSPAEETYEDAWKEDHPSDVAIDQSDDEDDEDAAKPVENAVKAAAKAQTESDAKIFSDVFHAEASPVAAQSATPSKDLPAMKPVAKTFKETFAAARAKGEKVFDWNGKKFTTEMAKSNSPKDGQAVAVRTVAKPAQPASTVAEPKPVSLAPSAEGERKPLTLNNSGNSTIDVDKQIGLGGSLRK